MIEPMQPVRLKGFAALLTFACLALALPETTLAEKTKFPSDDPAFSIELPRGWTSEVDKAGNLDCHAPDDPAYSFGILDMRGIKSTKELKAALLKVAEGTGLKKMKVGEVEETGSETMKFLEVKAHGESDGLQLVVVVTGFEAQKGRFFALLGVGLEEMDKKHAKDYESIAASIEPLMAKSAK